jgi:hypothetical protein
MTPKIFRPKPKFMRVDALQRKDRFIKGGGGGGNKSKTGAMTLAQRLMLKNTQADRVIHKFGGPGQMCKLLGELGPEYAIHRITIYRWTYPKGKFGTGGVIPTRAMVKIMRAARLLGIHLEPDDFYPGKK